MKLNPRLEQLLDDDGWILEEYTEFDYLYHIYDEYGNDMYIRTDGYLELCDSEIPLEMAALLHGMWKQTVRRDDE